YAAPIIALSIARIALLISIFLPYWHMQLLAPQYPDGLSVTAYLNRLEGDVREIDSLNHYIGMRPLGDAAKLERSLSIAGLIALVLLVEGATYIHTKWAALLAVPAIGFPVFFLADLYYWLNNFGQNLDPTAAMSSSVKPFTPPLLGTGMIGQFETHASMGLGLKLAFVTSVLTIIGLYLHRRAYKPLVEAARSGRRGEPAT
ncbi:MAG: hypothetical protein KDA37_15645, partial [Planctomycetales bacterium]|nr:hypothetical protein [Planctomycetales bacterium]